MMVIFLVGLVSMILMRTLRKDYARYAKDLDDIDDMVCRQCAHVNVRHFLQERDLGDEYGWKQVHGDVFRPPSMPMFFSSLIGTGYQVGAVVGIVIVITMVGELYTE